MINKTNLTIKPKTYNTKPVTIRYAVADYLEAMHKAYTEKFRSEWETLDRKYKNEEERWNEEVRRGWGDIKMKLNDKKAHSEALRGIRGEFEQLKRNATQTFDELMTEADGIFERHSRATGDKIDLQTIELLKSGALTDDELKALVGDFEGNIAMLHIIAPYVEERAKATQHINSSHELPAIAYKCKTAAFNYREPLERYAAVAEEALSADETHSKAYHKVLTEKAYFELLEESKDLYISENYEG